MCQKVIDTLIERKKALADNKELLKQEKRKTIKFKDVSLFNSLFWLFLSI